MIGSLCVCKSHLRACEEVISDELPLASWVISSDYHAEERFPANFHHHDNKVFCPFSPFFPINYTFVAYTFVA